MSEVHRVVWPQTHADEVCGEWYWGGLRAPKVSEKPAPQPADKGSPPSAEPVRSG
jgi:hypothetical protein